MRAKTKTRNVFGEKATEILYRGAAGGKPHLIRRPRAGYYPSTWLAIAILVWLGGHIEGPANASIKDLRVSFGAS